MPLCIPWTSLGLIVSAKSKVLPSFGGLVFVHNCSGLPRFRDLSKVVKGLTGLAPGRRGLDSLGGSFPCGAASRSGELCI